MESKVSVEEKPVQPTLSLKKFCNESAEFSDFGFFHIEDPFYDIDKANHYEVKHKMKSKRSYLIIDEIDLYTMWASA